jgi:hypothetical protein
MKPMTIALAIVLAFPNAFALAEGTMNYSAPVVRPVVGGVTVTPPIATRPRSLSGNPLAPIAHDPSGLRIIPSAMNRGG